MTSPCSLIYGITSDRSKTGGPLRLAMCSVLVVVMGGDNAVCLVVVTGRKRGSSVLVVVRGRGLYV